MTRLVVFLILILAAYVVIRDCRRILERNSTLCDIVQCPKNYFANRKQDGGVLRAYQQRLNRRRYWRGVILLCAALYAFFNRML